MEALLTPLMLGPYLCFRLFEVLASAEKSSLAKALAFFIMLMVVGLTYIAASLLFIELGLR